LAVLGGSFLFAFLVTELLQWSLEVKIPALFKVSIYSMLAIPFFFPLTVSLQQYVLPDFDARWLSVGFSIASSLAILTLIPAIRMGRAAVAKNGTPWEWPMFPYSIFVLLVVGLCGRMALFTLSFDPTIGSGSILGSYLFAPIALAVLWVLLEIAIVEKIELMRALVVYLSPLVLLLSLNWDSNYGQRSFTNLISNEIGSPLWLCLMGLVFMFAVAHWRQVKGVGVPLILSLIASVVIQRTGGLVTGVNEIAVWPCVVLAIASFRNPNHAKSFQWLKASFWLSFVIARVGASFTIPSAALPIGVHWLLFAAILIGFAFNDRFAKQLRIAGAIGLPIFALVFWIEANIGHILDPSWTLPYATVCATVGYLIYHWHKELVYYCASAIALMIAFLSAGVEFQPQISQAHRQTFVLISLGLACFVFGVLVSCLKAGMAHRLRKSVNKVLIEISQAFVAVEHQNMEQS
jgi:hypothetical protein